MAIRRVVSLMDTKSEEHGNAQEARPAFRGYLGPMAGGAASQDTARNLVLASVASVALMLLIVMAHSWQYRDVLPSVLEGLEFVVGFLTLLGGAQALCSGSRGVVPCVPLRADCPCQLSTPPALPPHARRSPCHAIAPRSPPQDVDEIEASREERFAYAANFTAILNGSAAPQTGAAERKTQPRIAELPAPLVWSDRVDACNRVGGVDGGSRHGAAFSLPALPVLPARVQRCKSASARAARRGREVHAVRRRLSPAVSSCTLRTPTAGPET